MLTTDEHLQIQKANFRARHPWLYFMLVRLGIMTPVTEAVPVLVSDPPPMRATVK